MKRTTLFLSATLSLLAASCNQTAPVTSAPTANTAPDVPIAVDSAKAEAATAPDAAATSSAPAAAPQLKDAETLKLAFAFKPAPNPDDPAHPRTSAHLLLQGSKPQDIDLGKFAGKPDVVDAAKAKAANFPAGTLLGFRSYQAATGISQDLAVLNEDGRHLRIVQRRVEETATEPGAFETAREIPLAANTMVVVAPAKK
ncbi:hypothetical protein [Hymenobacter properus]|uniref:Lipoprotein n=1 Tax=Hymenobacter properus TaxID=2791026 RepID=A0A931BQC1_9BACT|nr:hypothetical protein [Hymenobacter properus]MBF9143665.1 hypothetical protein [Hymenobacter properus]MBR7722478.1 hypothetical protein [Microvirga sp. SRT04]